MDILIQNGTAVLEHEVLQTDIAVSRGKITEIAPHINAEGLCRGGRIINARGSYLFPGFIDAHTHYGIPGSADDFYSGSRAAAFGGVTSFIDFSDQLPGLPLVRGAEKRIQEASKSVLDFALHQGVYHMHEHIGRELEELCEQGITAVKVFSTYEHLGLKLDPVNWDKLFSLCSRNGILVTMHAEDDGIIETAGAPYRNFQLAPEFHGLLRPDEAEYRAVIQAGTAAGAAALYIVHLSSARGLEAIRMLRAQGVRVCAETAPHYLLLDSTRLEGGDGALFMMTPPLRSREDGKALFKALQDGEISVVATDHCAFTRDQKFSRPDCREIPAGIPGSEELSSLIYTFGVAGGLFDLLAMKNMLSENPAKIFGIFPRKGVLREGSDADITIFSPEEGRIITAAGNHSNAGYTPYEGFRVSGSPVMTIAGGRVLTDNGRWFGSPGMGSFIPAGVSSLYQGKQ